LTDWIEWHEAYDRSDSSQARRLDIVRTRISEALEGFPPGPIRVISMCAGDGRDLLHVLRDHGRAGNVVGRLVELDVRLAERARAVAPPGVEIVCGDAAVSDAYEGAVPADLLLCCGVFGNVSNAHVHRTIGLWPMLCAPDATVIWTRGASAPDRRDVIRRWVIEAGFDELAFYGAPEVFGVGVARMVRTGDPFRCGVRFFAFRAAEVA
jgi:hypothetical protein